jgi:protein-S-isoprenylcysteine O-methyltransferase Ste14
MHDALIVFAQVLILFMLSLSGLVESLGGFSTLSLSSEWLFASQIVFYFALIFLLWGGLALGSKARILPKPASGAKLKTSGAYAFCRHPMYSALILGAFAWSFYKTSYWGLGWSVFLCVLLHHKARREERYLLEVFGEAYTQYKKKVGRFFPKR